MLDKEEAIKQRLIDKFDFMAENCTVNRERRLTATAPREMLLETAKFLRDELGFDSLCTITGLDSGENYELIYHMANGGIVMNLKALAPKADPVFDTITGLFEGAMMYELEVHNLLGLTVTGIPEDIKYPLPDSWPQGQYPLRKDWKKETPAAVQEGG
jgi:membrane-bound hydrogenase subunit beta